MLSVNLNLGIGKSTTISINNFPQERKKVSFKAIEYTKNISIIIFCSFTLLILINYLNLICSLKKATLVIKPGSSH